MQVEHYKGPDFIVIICTRVTLLNSQQCSKITISFASYRSYVTLIRTSDANTTTCRLPHERVGHKLIVGRQQTATAAGYNVGAHYTKAVFASNCGRHTTAVDDYWEILRETT